MAVLPLAGCPSAGSGPADRAAKPHAGAAVVVACPEPALARELAQLARGWGDQTGAAVRVEPGPAAAVPDADLIVLPTPDLGGWADRKELREVPAELRDEKHPTLGWSGLLPVYRGRLTGWAGVPLALPLAGEGRVLVYRADRLADPKHRAAFPAKYNRPLAPPLTWEDVAELAEFFAAADGRPSLPPLPAADRLLAEFHMIAACYDRKAIGEGGGGKGDRADADWRGPRALSFHHDVSTGRHRVRSAGFVTALELLQRMQRVRTPGGDADPVAALDSGSAVAAVLTLAEVGRLPTDATGAVAARFGVGPPPGTRGYCDPAGGRVVPATGNYVPYLGSGGWVAAVRAGSRHPDAAFDLAAEACRLPASLQRLRDPAAGFGPYRLDHLAHQRVWNAYRFDPPRTARLADGLRAFAAPALANPVLAPRTPDADRLLAALEAEVRRALTANVPAGEALAKAAEAWDRIDAATPEATRQAWRRQTAGVR